MEVIAKICGCPAFSTGALGSSEWDVPHQTRLAWVYREQPGCGVGAMGLQLRAGRALSTALCDGSSAGSIVAITVTVIVVVVVVFGAAAYLKIR